MKFISQPLCHSLDRRLVLFSALIGQWRYSLLTDKVAATMRIAQQANALAQGQNDAALMMGLKWFLSRCSRRSRQQTVRGENERTNLHQLPSG